MDFNIDFVVTWVDGSDPQLISKRKPFLKEESDERFRDYGIFKYWFRAVEKYAPWVHKIYLITDNQFPRWFNRDAEKVVVVDHTDIIAEKYLPTFNSNVIELSINNIAGLAEHFVVFNDDIFLNDYVRPDDFFDIRTGFPKDIAAQNAIMPIEDFDHITANNVITVNRRFNKKRVMLKAPFKYFNLKYGYWNVLSLCLLPWPRFTRFVDPHIPFSFTRSSFQRFISDNHDYVERTMRNRFRGTEDISINGIRYQELALGNFKPRSYRFGKKYDLTQLQKIEKDIKKGTHKVICINDTAKVDAATFDSSTQRLRELYGLKFAEKSAFEL